MAEFTNALLPIEQVVTTYLFAYKKPTEDYSLYMQHAAQCLQNFNLYDGNLPVQTKVTINSTLKCIEMPDDMQSFIDLLTPISGSWWSFTQKNQMVNTTTTTAGVESRDDIQGEGVKTLHDRTGGYGAVGGWNKFNMTLDWASRRIYIDDEYETTDYFVLVYVSSGIKVLDETLVPAFFTPVIDAYLLWKESYWLPEFARERQMRYQDYWKEKRDVRDLINSMSVSQWRDIFYSSCTQTIKR
jgi:hypothetical protein